MTKKRLVGYGFFAAVLMMTLYATTIPSASALEVCTAITSTASGGGSPSAGGSGGNGGSTSTGGGDTGEGTASAEGEVEVIVKVYSDNPSIVINQPADGSVLATSTVAVKESYSELDCLNNTITWGNYTANLGDYIPEGGTSAYGDYGMPINLMALGGYGTYNLKATLDSNKARLTDSTTFRYAPVVVTYVGTDENGDPVFRIDHDEYTNYVDLDLLKDGDSVLDGPIRVEVENPGEAGSMLVTIPAGSYGLETDDYTLETTAYGPTAEAEVKGTDLDLDAGQITATFDYDEYTEKVYFTVIDANGKALYVPEAVYTVLNYGTAGTDTIVIDLSGYDLSDYDFSSYTVIAHAYARPGSTENVKQLDIENGPVSIIAKYTRPAAPDVPDTGKILSELNISTADYWIFGLVVAGGLAAFAYYQTNKRKW